MSDFEGTIGQQKSSHEDLIEMVNSPRRPTSADTRVDAIIVPAAREAKNLTTAIGLAAALGCYLVVLCSKDTRPGRLRSLFKGQNLDKGFAVAIPDNYEIPDLRLETTEWVHDPENIVCGKRSSDLSVKRNIGLLIARMVGWQHIFFMDDDIRGISVYDLARTVALLGKDGNGYRSAGLQVERLDQSERPVEHFQASHTRVEYSHNFGIKEEHYQFSSIKIQSSSMQVKHFPDNSVVCHARRMVGEHQDVFVSGSVLAVDCTAPFDFFPDLYNEDWLFFYRNAAERKLASPGVQATKIAQIKYNPFANWQRAEREEFGDVIAEGLYSLLHHCYGPHSPTEAYWTRFLSDRKAVLDGVSKQVLSAPVELQDGIEASISAARHTLRKITPAMCVDYVAAWQRDLVRWKKRLRDLPVVPSVEDALRELGL